MPVASRQSAGLPMYRSYTGTLLAFTGAPPGHHRRNPGRCRSSVWARWSYGAVPVVPGAVPVVPGAAPVVAGPSR